LSRVTIKTNIVRLLIRIRSVWSEPMLFDISFSTCYRLCKQTAWILIRLNGCAGWSGSILVANQLGWFCRDAAYLWSIFVYPCQCQKYHFLRLWIFKNNLSIRTEYKRHNKFNCHIILFDANLCLKLQNHVQTCDRLNFLDRKMVIRKN
jgi:hypothetical protein